MFRLVVLIIVFSVFMGLAFGTRLPQVSKQQASKWTDNCPMPFLVVGIQVIQLKLQSEAFIDWTIDSILSQHPAHTKRFLKVPSLEHQSMEADKFHFPSTMWYPSTQIKGAFLYALSEYPINTTRDKFVFRILYLPAYEHPICLRLEHSPDGKMVLFAKESNGKGGFGPGEYVIERKIQLSGQDYSAFSKEFERANFFQKPVEAKNETGYDTYGGSGWLFETNKFGQYHCLDRNTDTYDDGNMREITVMLLKRAGILRVVH